MIQLRILLLVAVCQFSHHRKKSFFNQVLMEMYDYSCVNVVILSISVSPGFQGLPYNNWNSRSHLADIYQLITNLRLPWFHYEDRSATDWIHVCRDVWTFVSGICSSTSPSAPLTARCATALTLPLV